MKIALFVGTRADLGPLEPVIRELHNARDIELHIITGVAFEADELAGYLLNHMDLAVSVHQIAPRMSKVDQNSVLDQGELLVSGTKQLFTRLNFECLIVLGDRWELLYIVPQAYLKGIRIVHLHGGEITEGALDDRVRHAVSKLADAHCVASHAAARRLEQLGEPPERIFRTGAPGLQRIKDAASLTNQELTSLLGREIKRPLTLFTYHAPTLQEDSDIGALATAALEATVEVSGSVIVTSPGFDVGREAILKAITKMRSLHPEIIFVESLGTNYPATLKSVDLVVGNSSSGVIEAASARVPSVDIGIRQQGRERSASVLHADEGYANVKQAIQEALELLTEDISAFDNPYWGDAPASGVLDAVRIVGSFSKVKKFYDLQVETGDNIGG